MTELLLATKFCVPPQRTGIVSRLWLVERLEAGLRIKEGFGRRLTLISAPAGYGKTTLAIEWLQSSGLPVGWLSLDESDNDPRRFITYLIAAMKVVDKNIGQAASAMLKSPQPPPNELMLTALVNEISAVPQAFALVLDDYHVIHTPPIHQQLAFLLDHQPTNLHLIITTREDPLLPIPRLRAQGQVLEIRQDDLRFTENEASQFLQSVMGLDLSPDEISALERRTEGWIAGLQLAALSMQGRNDLSEFIRAFTGSSRFILDYLIDEVFEQQSSAVKDFLLKTSILERLSSPLCDAVAEVTTSQEMLESLEQANLFIVPLDQSRGWYRYHRLFAELLRHRLRLSGMKEDDLHRRASLWFEQNGFMADAVQHALAGRNWERAVSLIRMVSDEMLKRGEMVTLIGWYQALPEEMLQTDPGLCFSYCWPLLLAGQLEIATPLLERVEQAAKDAPPEFLGEIFAAQAYLALGQGDHARMVEKSQQALVLLPKSSVNTRGVVALNLGLAYWHMGQMQAAEEILAETLQAAQAADNHYAALTAIIFQGRVCAVRGQLHQAAKYFKRAIQMGGEMPITVLAHLDMSSLHYEWNELNESDIHLQKAILLSQRGQNDEFLAAGWMMKARLCIAQGDLPGAQAALEKAWILERNGKVSEAIASRLEVAQVRLQLALGEPKAEWSQKLSNQVDCHSFYRFLGVTKANILPAPQARAYLASLSQAAQANDWVYGLIAVRALQAATSDTQDEALGFLTDVLQKAEGGGFVRTFVEAGENLTPSLREAARRGVTPDYTARILAVMAEKVDTEPAVQASLVEPLSQREIEVLRLVTSGMSNREIARQLFISPGTAKTHVHNLCGKLGVRNRTEAAMKAKELKLV
ncbi:MAG: LuxR C-terminal-related transcriptional regulator [Anaerolineales bacterium]|jgi:LuxR family maltose regulon positive regulatory protein